MLVIMKRLRQISCFLGVVTLLSCISPMTVKAEINEENSEEIIAQTAYVDMSSVGPLQLYFTEEGYKKHPDYYYASVAYNILQERAQIDSMYQNCTEVIVVVNHKVTSDEVMNTGIEPQVKTGYLNLQSSDSNKCFTIDNVTIHIQRENQ